MYSNLRTYVQSDASNMCVCNACSSQAIVMKTDSIRLFVYPEKTKIYTRNSSPALNRSCLSWIAVSRTVRDIHETGLVWCEDGGRETLVRKD